MLLTFALGFTKEQVGMDRASELLPAGWYMLDTRWACGAVRVEGGQIVEGAPIFRRMFGQVISLRAWGRAGYKFTRLEGQ